MMSPNFNAESFVPMMKYHNQYMQPYQLLPPLKEIPQPVSNIFKKTCYKCGNLGHFAENCKHSTRLCYNCKKPGHESSSCKNPRNGDLKQCYFCKKIGHVQADCKFINSNNQSNYINYSGNYNSSGNFSENNSRSSSISSNGSSIQTEFSNEYQQIFYYIPHSPKFENSSIASSPASPNYNQFSQPCNLCGIPNHPVKDCFYYNPNYYSQPFNYYSNIPNNENMDAGTDNAILETNNESDTYEIAESSDKNIK